MGKPGHPRWQQEQSLNAEKLCGGNQEALHLTGDGGCKSYVWKTDGVSWGIQSKKPNLVLESAVIHEEFSQRSDWVRDGVGGGGTKYREGQRLGVFQIDPF